MGGLGLGTGLDIGVVVGVALIICGAGGNEVDDVSVVGSCSVVVVVW